jgi:LmbE family N-acetylglucosaminyl deacetylase
VGTLVLSPHADDAALSIGGSLLLRAYPAPVRLLTVFSRSSFGYGQLCADARAVTAKRREEDLHFAAVCGAHFLSLDLPDAPLRQGPGAETVFALHPHAAVVPPVELAERLARAIADSEPSCVLAPLGLGAHRDHLLVQRAAWALAEAQGFELTLYEDLPYAARLSAAQIYAHAKLVNHDLLPIEISIQRVMAAKLDALKCYPSQLGEADARAVQAHARRCQPRRHRFSWFARRWSAYERLWARAEPSWLQPEPV